MRDLVTKVDNRRGGTETSNGRDVGESNNVGPPPTNSLGQFFKRIRTRSKSPLPPANRNKAWTISSDGVANDAIDKSPSNSVTSPSKIKPEKHHGFGTKFGRASMDAETSPSHSVGFASWIGAKFSGKSAGASEKKASRTMKNGALMNEIKTSDKRGALSEQDLVSKSLACELEHSIIIVTDNVEEQVDNHADVPAPGSLSSYLSQDSVFDAKYRQPSYLRVSCALNGYRNFRPGALTPTQPVRNSNTTATGLVLNGNAGSCIPKGRSMVERRLEKFENVRSSNVDSNSIAVPKDFLPEAASTPVRQLVSTFNSQKGKSTPVDLTSPDSGMVTGGDRPKIAPPAPPEPRPAYKETDIDEFTIGCKLAENSDSLLDEVLKATGNPSVETNGQTVENGLNVGNCADSDIDDSPGLRYKDRALLERKRLTKLVAEAEGDLDRTGNEEAEKYVRLAVGKSKLLLRKKFTMLEELIEENLRGASAERVVKEADLEGYWQLVVMELADVRAAFAKVAALRTHHWDSSCLPDEHQQLTDVSRSERSPRGAAAKSSFGAASKRGAQPRSPKTPTSPKAKNPEVARSEAKERLRQAKLAAKKRLQQQQQTDGDDSDVKIFVPN